MAPSKPPRMQDESSDHNEDTEPTALATVTPGFVIPAEMSRQLHRAGIDPAAMRPAFAPLFWKIGWEDLCYLRTQDEKTMASQVCAVVSITEMPEVEQIFPEYIGIIRVEFFTEQGAAQSVTHSRCRVSGEYLPLTEWLLAQTLPFYMRFGYVETNKPGRHVVRPLPADIEVFR